MAPVAERTITKSYTHLGLYCFIYHIAISGQCNKILQNDGMSMKIKYPAIDTNILKREDVRFNFKERTSLQLPLVHNVCA